LIKTVIALTLDAAMPAGASVEEREREFLFLDSLAKLRVADVMNAIQWK
jgi:hypothetical protein